MTNKNHSGDDHPRAASVVGDEVPADSQLPLNRQLSAEDCDLIAVAVSTGPGTKSAELTAAAPLVIDAAEFASLLQISQKTLDRLLIKDQVPQPILIGRQRRWSRKAVEAWVEDGGPLPRLWRRAKEFGP